KDCIIMNQDIFNELKTAKLENYNIIYRNDRIDKLYNENIQPMFHEVYYKLLELAKDKKKDSVLYRHHIDFIQKNRKYYSTEENYLDQEPNQIVVDYIASMTDDYFIDLYHYLFPHGKYRIDYISYFD
ncbi:MAG: phosphohydrolase, partial [Oscillospiraceae bacterium]